MPIPCDDCGRNMRASAGVCLYCGHRQTRGIANGTMECVRPSGPMALIVPSAEASGGIRGLEWLLTILALPLLFTTLAVFAVHPHMWRVALDSGETALTLGIGFFGGIGLLVIGISAGLSGLGVAGLVGTCCGALVARLVVRSMRPN